MNVFQSKNTLSPGQFVQWIERQPVVQRVPGLTVVEGTYLGPAPSPAWALVGTHAGDSPSMCFPHIHVSLCLSFSSALPKN